MFQFISPIFWRQPLPANALLRMSEGLPPHDFSDRLCFQLHSVLQTFSDKVALLNNQHLPRSILDHDDQCIACPVSKSNIAQSSQCAVAVDS